MQTLPKLKENITINKGHNITQIETWPKLSHNITQTKPQHYPN